LLGVPGERTKNKEQRLGDPSQRIKNKELEVPGERGMGILGGFTPQRRGREESPRIYAD